MATEYDGVDSFPTGIMLPDDGIDDRSASSVDPALEGLADRTKALGLNLRTALGDLTALAAIAAPTDGMVRHVLEQGLYVFKTSATTGVSPFRVAAADATPGGWKSSTAHQTSVVRMVLPGWCPLRYVAGGGTPALVDAPARAAHDIAFKTLVGGVTFQTVTTGAAHADGFEASINEYLIDGATVTQIRARVSVNSHGALPLFMPRFGVLIGSFHLEDFDVATQAMVATNGGMALDTSATVGAYNAEHYITFAPTQNAVVDKAAKHYAIVAFNEGYTNGVLGLSFLSFEITQTIPDARRA
jgi:hypothetical protein